MKLQRSPFTFVEHQGGNVRRWPKKKEGMLGEEKQKPNLLFFF